LDYWKANTSKYPVLSNIARNYLQIPASSASSERFFSQGALIISKLRNRLNKDTFEKIISLKSWGVFKDKEEEEERKHIKDLSFEDNLFIIEEKE
jgi:hAT family C-terminal dimerisation region